MYEKICKWFVSIVIFGFVLITQNLKGLSAERKSSIIVIVADDLGYADIGVHGCKDIPTPNIDSLAKNGVRFTSGYVSGPVCSPTRAGLITGTYQQRFGHEFNPGGDEFGLSLKQVTLANVLKDAGYVTGIVGKWHLGMSPEYHPFKRGFDEFFGFLGGSHSYLKSMFGTINSILRGTQQFDEKRYLTDAFTEEAISFIERNYKKPFFLYLTYNAVHGPLEATEKYLNRFSNISDEKRRTYAAMLSAMDDGIGEVLKKMRELGIEKDTIIFFLSDNGGPLSANGSDNTPLREKKGTLYEGGVRVPFIIQWKGNFPEGKVYENPVISLDIFPTCAAIAGGKLPKDYKNDGVNLVPYLTGVSGKNVPPHEILFWRSGTKYAVRKDNWKLVMSGDVVELYDLSQDIGESNDLSKERPGIVKELNSALMKWDSELSEPLWGGGRYKRHQKK